MHPTEKFQPPATTRAYESPKLLRFGRVTVLTKAGSNQLNDEMGSAQSQDCTTNTKNRPCTQSDIRLKRDIVGLNEARRSVGIYAYRYVPSLHSTYGSGIYVGVMAQEVREIYPEVVIEQDDGYLAVDYARLNRLLAANTGAPAHAA